MQHAENQPLRQPFRDPPKKLLDDPINAMHEAGRNYAARKRNEPVGKAPQDMQPEEKNEIRRKQQLPL